MSVHLDITGLEISPVHSRLVQYIDLLGLLQRAQQGIQTTLLYVLRLGALILLSGNSLVLQDDTTLLRRSSNPRQGHALSA